MFNLQNQWLFAVFTKTLKDPTAKDILCQYQHNGDSQQIYAKLKSKARKSAKVTLAKMRFVEFLTTGKLDHSWKGSHYGVILLWCAKLREFEEVALTNEHYNSS